MKTRLLTLKAHILAIVMMIAAGIWSQQTMGQTSTGAVFPGTGTTGGGGVAWTNPIRVTANDGSSASAALTTVFGNPTSQTLSATGFNFSSIPAGATILGIQVTVGRSASGGSVADNSIKLLKAGAAVGTNKASATTWPTSITAASYGSATDLWGTTWTTTDLTNAGFGVGIIAANSSFTNNRTANVDYVTINVSYTLPTKLVITSITPTSPVAGSAFSVTIQSQDAGGNLANVTSATNISLSVATGTGNLGGTLTGTIANGTNAVTISGVTYNVGESGVSILATQTSGTPALTAGTSAVFTVQLPASKLVITSISPSSPTAGVAFSVTIQSQDANGVAKSVTSSTGVVLSLATGTGTLSGTLTGTIASGTSSVTISTPVYSIPEAGVSLTATQTSGTPTLTAGTSATFTVIAPATQLAVISITPASPASGVAFSVVVQAQDANGNPTNVTSATAVVLSKATGTGALGGTLTGTIASGTNSVTIATPTYTVAETGVSITATRTSGMNLTPGTSATFTVIAGALAKFSIATIASQVAGTPFNITITAQDVNGNTLNAANGNAFTGTGTLTTNAATGTISPTTSASFVDGVLTQSVTVTQATNQAIKITSASKTGTSNTFAVTAGAFAQLRVLLTGEAAAPGSATGKTGTPTNISSTSNETATVSAVDANFNVVTTNTDVIHITSTDGAAALPADGALVAGTKNFTVVLSTTGPQTITASDVTDGSSTATSATVTVTGFATATSDFFRSNVANGQWTTAGTWQSSHSGTGNWFTATAAPTNGASGIDIRVGNLVFATANPSSANLTVEGTYEHRINGGTMPVATWNVGSTCLVTGVTNASSITNFPQNFYNLSWNNTQTNNYFSCGLTNTTLNIAGTVDVVNTGAGQFGLSNSGGSYTANLGAIQVDAGTFALTNSGTGNKVNVTGSITINGGTLVQTFGGAIADSVPVTLGGDWTNKGTFTTQAFGTVNFNGTVQNINGTATTTFNNLKISSSVSTTLNIITKISSNLTVSSGSLFDLGSFTANRVTSGGVLTVSGATLKLGASSGGQSGNNFPLNYATIAGGANGVSAEYYGTTQTIYNNVTYHNLIITNAGAKTLGGTMSAITGNLVVNPGATLDLVTFTANKSGTAGTLSLGTGSLLRLKGSSGGIGNTSNFPTNLTPTLDPASTVEYYGTAQQTAANVVSGYGNLTINNAAGLVLSNDQTVAGALNFVAGKLDATTTTLTLSSATPVINGASATSYIITDNGTFPGYLAVTNVPAGLFQFPIGTSTLYMPASVNPSTSTSWTANVFTPATTDGQYQSTPFTGTALNAIVNAIWTITPASGTTADLTLNWDASLEGSQFQLYADHEIGISHYNTSAGAFDPAIQTSASHLAHTVTANFSAFSPFGIGFINDPLPVVLVDFNAVLNSDKTVGLSWTTQQEVNSSHFDVLRSTDGSTWVSIGTVQAKGNASFVSNYTFSDKSPASGINYYRLKMVDIDGKFGYSNIRIIRTTSFSGISVFPNPARDYVNVSVGGSSSQKTIRLISQNGQVMQVKSVNSTTGTTVSLNVHNYVQGTYYLQIIGTDGTNQTTKVVIAR